VQMDDNPQARDDAERAVRPEGSPRALRLCGGRRHGYSWTYRAQRLLATLQEACPNATKTEEVCGDLTVTTLRGPFGIYKFVSSYSGFRNLGGADA